MAVICPFDARSQVDFIKANDATALNLAGSYTTPGGPPGTVDTIVFDTNFIAQNTSIQVGTGGLSVHGLRLNAGVTGTPRIAGTTTLTLGAGGLTKLNNVVFRIEAPAALSASQTWSIAGTGFFGLRWSSTLTTGGNNLLINGAGNLDLRTNNTLGSEVTIDIASVAIRGAIATFGGVNTFDELRIESGRLIGSTFGNYGVASNFGDGGVSTNIIIGAASTIGTFQYTGTTTSSNRDFSRTAPNLANDGALNGVIDVSISGQTLTLSGNLASASNAVNGGWSLGGSGNLTIQSDIVDQASTGVTSLDKFGDGVLTFSGTNSYEGATTVSAGTLLVNGSMTATSSVTVALGATLGGSGTINADTTINGNLSPGNSPGLLIFNDVGVGVADLTLAGTANSTFEINGTSRGFSYDAVDVEGLITYGGTLTLDFGFTPLISDTFNLFDFTSQTGSFSSVNFVDSGYAGTFDGTTGILSLSAIPEPGTFAMLLGGLGLLAGRRRRSKS